MKKNIQQNIINVYSVLHTWCFSDGTEGRYELMFYNFDEATAKFKYLQLLIETDEYNFDAKFSPFCEGDTSYSVYEDLNSSVNRQDLVLTRKELTI